MTEAGDSPDVFVALLRDRFGERALAVAERQCAAATGQAAAIWLTIRDRLRLD